MKRKLLCLLLAATALSGHPQEVAKGSGTVAPQKGNFQKGDYGYLFCHMNDRGRAWTAYALSRDGLHYHDLLSGDSIFSDHQHARIEGATRDAYICRKHDGTGYLMACTDMNVGRFKELGKLEEWDNYGITLLRSDDLIHWESRSFDFRRGPSIFSDPQAPSVYRNWSTVNRVWAPQIMWDGDFLWPDGKRGAYFVYYSMWNRTEERYDRMYYSYADETFTRLSQPRLLFDWGYATIDADINWVQADRQWHMMIKKEGGKPGLFTATAPALTGPWSEPVEDDYVSFEGNKKCEGVSAFQLAGHNDWMIGYIEYSSKPRNYRLCMADRYMRGFHSPRNIEGVARPQHGSFLRLTKEEYERLQRWSDAYEVVWFDGKAPITYSLPKKVEPVVKVALDMWKSDMQQVTGMTPVASTRATVKVIQRNGPADGFRIYTKDNQIIIEGSDARGMAYGILELSRMAGVSPWIWWGDIVPEKRQRLAVKRDFHTEQSPSVEYRGIFINDEDWSLRHWSYTTMEPAPFGHIGPRTYKKIFQLLLRLRANAIWPGMHTGTTAFFKIPGAKAMADSCGIVIGTSHCEPLLRNNVGEWDVNERGAFNYRTNREAVQNYWIERLKEVRKSKDNMFTIGMRGIHDSSMEGYHTDKEKFEGLQQVINDQQDLLRKYIGDPSRQMQVFVPYKEVLQLYENGLKVPDYVTLMWCDDNYGYMTRLSNAKEQQRSGGGGVYYHLSYWGRPHDYLWLTTTQPGLICNEMRQAYDHNVRKVWIANVHDPKVAGYDLELFLDMAWNIDCVSGQTLNDHYRSWLCRQFGQQAGEKLFPVMQEFFRLCGERRPEFMGWNQVEVDKKLYDRGLSQVRNSGWTAGQRERFLESYTMLSRKVEEIGKSIRPELADAYFTGIKYPVQASAAHAVKMLEAENARLMANGSTMGDMLQNQAKIQQSVNRSYAAYKRIHELTDYYNNKVAGGKWKNLMCDHPRDLPVFWTPLTPISPQISEDTVQYTAIPQHSSDIRGRESLQNPSPSVFRACDFSEATEGVRAIQMLGHSMNAVALPKGGKLTYSFSVRHDGEYSINTALIPTQPNDNGDLRYSVTVDGNEPTVYTLKEPFRSEQWKQNVLRGQALREKKVHLSEGAHQLTIEAVDDHIVVDQWWLSGASMTTTGGPRYDMNTIIREKLGRGVVAVRSGQQVIVSWRVLSSDKKGEAFDVYRNGVRLNKEAITSGGSFFVDDNPLEQAVYEVRGGVVNGSFSLAADAPDGYLPVKLQRPEGGVTPDGEKYDYSANDASVADVDGDGQYEIVLKWEPSNAHDNAHDGFTGPTLLDCYRIDGTLLWRIDLGINIRSGAHYTPFIVYDLDGDGKAELIVRTSDGTRDGLGQVIGDPLADYRHRPQEGADAQKPKPEREWGKYNRQGRPMTGRILTGNEYITVFNGLTGKAMDSKPYIPERGDPNGWGDNYANRSDRMLAAVGYLDGHHPSAIFCRGYYTRTVIAAWDWDGRQLTQHWVFDTNDEGVGRDGKPQSSYAGQGNHNLRVADVDGDGCDEITYGSMAVDNDGKGLYNTGMGHGDAIHLMAFDPTSTELQVWDCHENRRDGSDLRNANTGEVIFQIPSTSDVGRAMAADIDPTNPGLEMWSTDSHGIRNIKGEILYSAQDPDDPQHQQHLKLGDRYLSVNFGIWWDGDLLRELLDRETVSKYDWVNHTIVDLKKFDGVVFNNWTKSNPCIAADILGDWREEVVARTPDSSELRIFVSTIPTEYRINCLMEDIPYRLSTAAQNVGYNQPSEPGFYLGPDKTANPFLK